MVWVIISNILWSLSLIYWKKALQMSNISEHFFFLLNYIGYIIVAIWIIILWYYDFDLTDYKLLFIIIFLEAVWMFWTFMSQKLYKDEKISVLLPYQQLSPILSIIFSFFIFSDADLKSFFIAIITMIIVLIFSIDFKEFKLPKKVFFIILIEIIKTIKMLLIWYVLLKTSQYNLNVISNIWMALILLLIVLISWEIKKVKETKIWLYKNIWTSSFLNAFCDLIWLNLIMSLWIITSILLNSIWIWITLIFSYLFFKDIPAKKDIILAIIVSVLVWVNFIF